MYLCAHRQELHTNSNMKELSTIDKLCREVQNVSNIRLRTPKDYSELSLLIFQKTRTNISTSTLKRLMGYLPNGKAQPRLSTLDILAHYVGYTNYESFTESLLQAHKRDIDLVQLKRDIHTLSIQMNNCCTMLQHLEERLK